MSAFPAFVGADQRARSPVGSNQKLINFFVEPLTPPGATARAMLLPTPGVNAFCALSTSGGRGAFYTEGRFFVVYGPTLYEVFANMSVTPRGTVALDGNPVTFSTNGEGGAGGDGELLITSGGNAYQYNLTTNALTLVLTGNVLQAGATFGYFLAFLGDRVRISDVFDGATWDPLEFFQRGASPDAWQAMLADPYGYVFLPGSKTGESWFPNGAASVPFDLDKSTLIEEGIAAPFSLRQAGKSKVWLSTNANGGYQVMRATGFTPQPISDFALNTAIASYGDVSDAIGDTYESRGHAFYALTFPSVPITWEYNFRTNLWHQRGTWISEENRYVSSRLAAHTFAFSKQFAVDRASNVLYEVSDAYATDIDGRPIRRLRSSPAVGRRAYEVSVSAAVPWRIVNAFHATRQAHRRVFYDALSLQMDTGVGVPAGNDEDEDPTVMLRCSDDYGQSYGPEQTASAGRSGDRDVVVEWWGLGSAETEAR